MTDDLKLLNEEFTTPTRARARVLPGGFAVEETEYLALRGRIASWTLVRKRFREQRLVCWSNDGEHAVSGQACEPCTLRRECSRRIRLSLERVQGERAAGTSCLGPLVLELNFTSARNFLAYAHQLAQGHLEVPELPARLTVTDHGSWGEVGFVLLREPVADGEAGRA